MSSGDGGAVVCIAGILTFDADVGMISTGGQRVGAKAVFAPLRSAVAAGAVAT